MPAQRKRAMVRPMLRAASVSCSVAFILTLLRQRIVPVRCWHAEGEFTVDPEGFSHPVMQQNISVDAHEDRMWTRRTWHGRSRWNSAYG